MKTYALILLLLAKGTLFSQDKKTLDYTVYNDWNTISQLKQSKSGQLITYEINPYEGDSDLHIEKIDGSFKSSINRGSNATISNNENHVVYLIQPAFDSIRKLKLDKVKKDKFPNDTLAIYTLDKDSTLYYPNIKSYQLSEENQWIAFLSHNDLQKPCKQKKCKIFNRKNKCNTIVTSGKTLYIMDLTAGTSQQIHGVTNYLLSENGTSITYVTSEKSDTDSLSVHHITLDTWQKTTLLKKQLSISKLVYDKNSRQLAFYSTSDTNKLKNHSLYYWSPSLEMAKIIIDSNTTGMPLDQTVSTHSRPRFSWDGSKLYFGTAQIVRQDIKDTLLESEKAKLDIWAGNDLRIQPQQLSEKQRDERNTFLSVYHIAEDKFIPLETETITSVRTKNHGNANFALSYSPKPYQKSMTWDYPWKRDIYYTDLTNGEQTLIKKGHAHSSSISPSGDYFLWYDGIDSNWFSKKINTNDSLNLTARFLDLFTQEANGYPVVMNSKGYAGWTSISNTEFFIVYSNNDIYALCPSDSNKSFSLTNGHGQKNTTQLRMTRFDQDSTYLIIENNLIHGVDSLTQSEAYYEIKKNGTNYVLETKIETPHKFIDLSKASESDQIVFRRMSFIDYPEIETSTLSFNNPTTVTNVNPQQDEYNWGTVEMVAWTTFKGINLRGLLYKPENFDSTKSYPMITYFYETYTENIHNYYAPKPTASIIYATEYVSNGYIVFIPDISYESGYPAQSAYDCIVSGTDYLTKKHNWIDSTRLGLQGQSWGGYQTAQLITMTGKYKAAMAGAPVSNMISAYGGVRWKSGLSRMFQYEHGQSRIGYTIWEKPELYIENSPIFGLPNVKTPLLIMHNDGDGSVPWYQGIELYMGLRRLNQPVWLLNYNGDEHNLMKTANRRDLSIRMRQFFDYYLLGDDIPVWMEQGIPALDKGVERGLELKKPLE